MSGERKDDKNLRGSARRGSDARGARPTGHTNGRRPRAFRPLRWAWLLLLVALLAPAYDLFLPAGYKPQPGRRTVVIERGQSLHGIARELQRVGIIRSQAGFLVLARMMRLDRSVKAGQYSFRLGTSVPALLRALDRGMFGLNLITIPEGLMISETAALIQRQVGIRASALDSLSRDPALLDSLGVGAPSLEGWLAPDSYEWLPGTSPEVVLRTMVTRTRERVQRATAGYDSLPLGMNAHEVLTLASIVESESRAREERPHIARVYLNRLDRGMLLQADPTVGYALGRGPRSRLTFKDLRVVSPYNTYRHEGLPPGPICSPGRAAIEAVMNATPGVKDLYFVARGEGRHLFAPTYEQHLANIAFVRGKKAALAAREAAEGGAVPDSVGGGGFDFESPLSTEDRAVSVPPLKGTLLLQHSTIKNASTAPSPVAVVPATPSHTAHADSAGEAEHSAPAARPAAVAPTPKPAATGADKPAVTVPAKPAVAATAKPAARDTTRKAATKAATSPKPGVTGAAAKPAARDTTRKAPVTATAKDGTKPAPKPGTASGTKSATADTAKAHKGQ